jgi:hypothetical protein
MARNTATPATAPCRFGVTDDLRDIGGRIVRLLSAMVISVVVAIGCVAGFAQIITDAQTGATGWYAVWTFSAVFILSTISLNALFSRGASHRRRHTNLPVARLVRR